MTNAIEKTNTETFELFMFIPTLPKIITNGSQGSFWYKVAEKKKWLKLVTLNIGTNKPPSPLTKATVECVRYSSAKPDRDNLAASFKYVVDALVKCGVLVDDDDDCIVEMKYRWEKVSPGKGAVSVKVVEVN